MNLNNSELVNALLVDVISGEYFLMHNSISGLFDIFVFDNSSNRLIPFSVVVDENGNLEFSNLDLEAIQVISSNEAHAILSDEFLNSLV